MKKNKNKCNITILAYVFLIFNFINIKIDSLGLATANASPKKTKKERMEGSKYKKMEETRERNNELFRQYMESEEDREKRELENKAKTRRKTEDDTTETQQITIQSIAIRPARSAPNWDDVRSSLEKLGGSK